MKRMSLAILISLSLLPLVFIAAMTVSAALANPRSSLTSLQVAVSQYATISKMVEPATSARLRQIFQNNESAVKFCANPIPTLRELRVPIPQGMSVSAKLMTAGEGSRTENLSEGGETAIPNIYGVICTRIGEGDEEITVCWFDFDSGFNQDLPELVHGMEGSNVRPTILRDLGNVASALQIAMEPRAYLRRVGVRVPQSIAVTAELHGTSDSSSRVPSWPACLLFRFVRNGQTVHSARYCMKPRADAEASTEHTACCGAP